MKGRYPVLIMLKSFALMLISQPLSNGTNRNEKVFFHDNVHSAGFLAAQIATKKYFLRYIIYWNAEMECGKSFRFMSENEMQVNVSRSDREYIM